MGSCFSKGQGRPGKKSAKSTISEANSSDVDERAVRKMEGGNSKNGDVLLSPPAMAPNPISNPISNAHSLTPSPQPTTAITRSITPQSQKSRQNGTIAPAPTSTIQEPPSSPTLIRPLSPTPKLRSLSPTPPKSIPENVAAREQHPATTSHAPQSISTVAERRKEATAIMTGESEVAEPRSSTFPEVKASGLAERRATTPAPLSTTENLVQERKASPADSTITAIPPPPAPTPPPCAPTPPPMPPTPPPAKGGMATISEDAPLPSPTFGRQIGRLGPPRHGTFGYSFPPFSPPFGLSGRPCSPDDSVPFGYTSSSAPISRATSPPPSRGTPPNSPGEPDFSYMPSSAPISRATSPPLGMTSPPRSPGDATFGYTSSSAPISRTASPVPGRATPPGDVVFGYVPSSPPIGKSSPQTRSPTRATFGYKAVSAPISGE